MTLPTTSKNHAHNVDSQLDHSYQKFVKSINKIARIQYQSIMDTDENKNVRLVRTKIDLFDAYLNAIKPEWRQGYNCRACNRFLNGIGSFAIIDDNNNIVPLVFDFSDNAWVPEEFLDAFNALRDVFDEKNAGQLDIVTTAMVNELGDFLGVSNAGGFNHFALEMDRTVVINAFKFHAFDSVAKRHGVGKAEITLIHEWLREVSKFDFNVLTDLRQIRESDRNIIGHIRDAVVAYKSTNPNIYVRRNLIDQGLGLLYLKNSAVGTIIANMIDGKSFKQALDAYLEYVDPRYYKRPLRMPTEKQFEASVKWLEEKGYAEKLPVRFATSDEVRPYLDWVKPVEEEMPVKKGIFDKARTKVTEANETEKNQPEKIKVPLEEISMTSLIGIIKGHIAANELVGINHIARRLMVGSYVTCVDENGFEIYKDKQNTRNFLLVEPVEDFQVKSIATPTKPENDAVSGIKFDVDDFGRELIFFIKENHAWKVPLQSVVMPDDLLPEIQEHRRTIEHWSRSTPMNVDDKNQLMDYDNIVLNIAVSVGHGVVVETDKHIFQFAITTHR